MFYESPLADPRGGEDVRDAFRQFNFLHFPALFGRILVKLQVFALSSGFGVACLGNPESTLLSMLSLGSGNGTVVLNN